MIRQAIVVFARWIDYRLWGLEPPTPQELRRPAKITCYRHGQRRRPRPAVAQGGQLFAAGSEPWK